MQEWETGPAIDTASRASDVSPGPGRIPFNRPYTTGREFDYIRAAIANLHISGNGEFTARCTAWLAERTGSLKVLMTNSCTSALELAMMLAGIGPGDEVIMPSFTFVSTANAVVLRGGIPVFVDVRPDTLNLDERLIADAVTPRTKAIVPVHYAGVGCDMDEIRRVAEQHGLLVIEDAAQAIHSTYRSRPLGTFGELGCVSFHETKNVTCGEGGALLINREDWIERAEILQEKGTNRQQFFRGMADKYTWVDVGSSFLSSEINAAFLWAQLEEADRITVARLDIWSKYHARFAELERDGRVRRPIVPDECVHNAHMYYLLLNDLAARDELIARLGQDSIQAVFHYIPLHSAPAGQRHGRAHASLTVTDDVSDRLVRLPLWLGMGDPDVERVAVAVEAALR